VAKLDPKLINKKVYKHSEGKCIICGEIDYELLDVHRFAIAGKDGGKYWRPNITVLCSNCHRKVHAGKIQILGWHNSTKGKLLHIIRENGEEDFV